MDSQSSASAPHFNPPVCSIGSQEQLAKLYCALAKAQGEFEPIEKNRSGVVISYDGSGFPFEKQFSYADLAEITAKTRPALSKYGLATIQPVSHAKHGGGLALFTQLIHEDGGMLISELPLGLNTTSPRDMGSLLTFLRRYAKCAILDVSADDDLDGEHATETTITGNHMPEVRAGEVRTVDEEPEVVYCTDEQFARSLPSWVSAMKSRGFTAAQVIATASSRVNLTEAQKETIRENEPTQQDVTQ